MDEGCKLDTTEPITVFQEILVGRGYSYTRFDSCITLKAEELFPALLMILSYTLHKTPLNNP